MMVAAGVPPAVEGGILPPGTDVRIFQRSAGFNAADCACMRRSTGRDARSRIVGAGRRPAATCARIDFSLAQFVLYHFPMITGTNPGKAVHGAHGVTRPTRRFVGREVERE
jgi:hypothetical protein